jgi:GNAT superfamily N-acetyltransferase
MSRVIRTFAPQDAQPVSRLVCQNLEQVVSRDYSAKAIAVMVAANQPDDVIRNAAEWLTLVAWRGHDLVGTASLSGDRVRHVFVAVEQHGSGIGRALMTAIESAARDRQIERLQLQSGLSTVGFYEKLGYQPLKRLERQAQGQPLPVILMQKALSPKP